MSKDIESHRAKWAGVARANGWYSEPFYVQVWVNESGEITDSVSFSGMNCDIVTLEELECLECDEINAPEFYRDGVCGECQTVEGAVTPCPLGDGGFDCSPFCPSCAGKQFINGTIELLSDTDESVLELCRTLARLGEFIAGDDNETYATALGDAIELLKTYAGDSDLSGME